jgi:hypothetical protein
VDASKAADDDRAAAQVTRFQGGVLSAAALACKTRGRVKSVKSR